MSDTPRTDAEYARYPVLDTQRNLDAVLRSFSNQLERELAAMTKERDALRNIVKKFVEKKP